jgi:Na+-translocating ferredoxin:NAD+ oxidoreductase RnfD subunit
VPAPRTADRQEDSRFTEALDSVRRASTRAFARLPRPARLLWIFLAVLGGFGVAFSLHGLGLATLVTLPAMAALIDIMFQTFRFRSVRFPDAAIATGLLLALLLPPTVSILPAQSVAALAITLRHVLRYRERPILNPAALGVIVGVLVFGMAPSWWGSITPWLVVLLGIVLTFRTPGSWRLPVSFLVAYAALSPLLNLLLGESVSPQVLLLGALDPSMLFFAFFMVAEPRTSLSRATDQLVFGLSVGIGTAFLPALIPSLAPFIALLIGNVLAVAVRQVRAAEPAPRPSKKAEVRRTAKRRRERHDEKPAPEEVANKWGVGHRIAAALLVVVLVGTMAVIAEGPSQTPASVFRPGILAGSPSSGGGRAWTDCTRDNPAVASDILSSLHSKLGPSKVLSVDSNTGTVVFYDPVNKATITETDMYEDYGYAEFNGDDYAVMGCSP